METWKSEATFIRSRCGFCKQEFTKWQDRVDHLSKHFRAGAQMKDWKGCRGLDPAVAAQVTNAMPPYLIGNEARTPFPFSASNESTWAQNLRITAGPGDETNMEYTTKSTNWADVIALEGAIMSGCTQAMSTAVQATAGMVMGPMCETINYSTRNAPGHSSPGAITCWEILTTRLGQYVKEQTQIGVIPTDEMLQRHARQILYEDDDSWNQTAADNQEWLELFKKAHGLPSTATDARIDLDEDLGARLGDFTFDAFIEDSAWDLPSMYNTMLTSGI